MHIFNFCSQLFIIMIYYASWQDKFKKHTYIKLQHKMTTKEML